MTNRRRIAEKEYGKSWNVMRRNAQNRSVLSDHVLKRSRDIIIIIIIQAE
jgi:hypothetical protein